jgi:hypothetical protein
MDEQIVRGFKRIGVVVGVIAALWFFLYAAWDQLELGSDIATRHRIDLCMLEKHKRGTLIKEQYSTSFDTKKNGCPPHVWYNLVSVENMKEAEIEEFRAPISYVLRDIHWNVLTAAFIGAFCFYTAWIIGWLITLVRRCLGWIAGGFTNSA